MNPVKKNRLVAFLLLAVLVFTTGMGKQVQGQELQAVSKVESEAEQKVKGIAPAKKLSGSGLALIQNTRGFFWIFQDLSNTR